MPQETESIRAALRPGDVAVAGFPFDHNSSYLRGAALAPARIREALHSPSANLCAESGIDLGRCPQLRDIGDLPPTEPPAFCERVRSLAAEVLGCGARLLALGGDHSITYPLLKAYARYHPGLSVLQLDAHPDLYDEFDGNRLSHASPFARILEEGLTPRLVQIGIRTLTPHQRDQAARFAVEIIEMRAWRPDLRVSLDGPVYLSLDLDVLDPAFAPGVSHHEPGGVSSREVLNLIQSLPANLVGADIVELNPRRDPAGITAMTAAKFLKEIAAKMLA
jgi:agmatinase